jgi:hypothetical protein
MTTKEKRGRKRKIVRKKIERRRENDPHPL